MVVFWCCLSAICLVGLACAYDPLAPPKLPELDLDWRPAYVGSALSSYGVASLGPPAIPEAPRVPTLNLGSSLSGYRSGALGAPHVPMAPSIPTLNMGSLLSSYNLGTLGGPRVALAPSIPALHIGSAMSSYEATTLVLPPAAATLSHMVSGSALASSLGAAPSAGYSDTAVLSSRLDQTDQLLKFAKGLSSRPQMLPTLLADRRGQFYMPVRNVAAFSPPFLLEAGLHFAGPVLRDLELAEQGTWRLGNSYTVGAAGTFALGQARDWVLRDPTVSGGLLVNAARLSYGVDKAASGVYGQVRRGALTPNIDEITDYLDAAAITAWGFVGGRPGAAFARLATRLGREWTAPRFYAVEMERLRLQFYPRYAELRDSGLARGIWIGSFEEVYHRELFGQAAAPALPQLPRLSGEAGTPPLVSITTVRTVPLNTVRYLGDTRISTSGMLTRVTQTSVSPMEGLVARVMPPVHYYDPMESSTYATRSLTTTTITTAGIPSYGSPWASSLTSPLSLNSSWATPNTSWMTVDKSWMSAPSWNWSQPAFPSIQLPAMPSVPTITVPPLPTVPTITVPKPWSTPYSSW